MSQFHNRREFIQTCLTATAGVILARRSWAEPVHAVEVPSYLKGYEKFYQKNPRAAAIQWFRDAKFGMFPIYGLFSLLERHEWVQFKELIPVAEYAKLKDRFTAEKFNADTLTDLALAAGMRYVNITARFHDSFCLFNTKQTDFNSVNSPAKRDLVGELAEACRKKGLGLCLYYSHGRDWRHPDAPNNDEWGGSARPKYKTPEPAYHYGKDHDLQRYLDFMKAQITELLTNYGPIAAIWLDGIAVPMSGDRKKFKCQELYNHIHRLQPQVLVSYKQGLLGTEDFFAPEHKAVGNPSNKPMEICSTLQDGSWGYHAQKRHISTSEAWAKLAAAGAAHANLLLSVGLRANGAIPPEQAQILSEMGRRIRGEGFPTGQHNSVSRTAPHALHTTRRPPSMRLLSFPHGLTLVFVAIAWLARAAAAAGNSIIPNPPGASKGFRRESGRFSLDSSRGAAGEFRSRATPGPHQEALKPHDHPAAEIKFPISNPPPPVPCPGGIKFPISSVFASLPLQHYFGADGFPDPSSAQQPGSERQAKSGCVFGHAAGGGAHRGLCHIREITSAANRKQRVHAPARKQSVGVFRRW